MTDDPDKNGASEPATPSRPAAARNSAAPRTSGERHAALAEVAALVEEAPNVAADISVPPAYAPAVGSIPAKPAASSPPASGTSIPAAKPALSSPPAAATSVPAPKPVVSSPPAAATSVPAPKPAVSSPPAAATSVPAPKPAVSSPPAKPAVSSPPAADEVAPAITPSMAARAAAEAEARRSRRFPFEIAVDIVSEHNFYAGLSLNISEGGLFVATHVEYKVGTRLEIRLLLPDDEEPTAIMTEVRWVRPHNADADGSAGMGLRFVDLAPAVLEKVSKFARSRDPLYYEDD
jgi:uncharacterized protein (TIGR02266 family)